MKLLNKIIQSLGYVHKSELPGGKDEFLNSMTPLIAVPFNGDRHFIRVRRPNYVEIREAGDMSLIETITDKRINRRPKKRQIKEYTNAQIKILKKALISPTYDEIMEWVCGVEFVKEIHKELEDCKKELSRTPRGPQRDALENQLDDLFIASNLILPTDFIGSVISWVFDIENTNIKDITEEMLIEAAILAEKGHDNPADHLNGKFTDFNREDINKRAMVILHEKREERKKDKKGKR